MNKFWLLDQTMSGEATKSVGRITGDFCLYPNAQNGLKRVYEEGVECILKRCCPAREPEWTESLAVGDKCFIEAASKHFSTRRTLTYAELTGTNQIWTIKESTSPYNADSAMKSASNAKKKGSNKSNFMQ